MYQLLGIWACVSFLWLLWVHDKKSMTEGWLRGEEAEVKRLDEELKQSKSWEARYERDIKFLKEKIHDLEVIEVDLVEEARQDQEEIEELKETIAKLKKNQ